MEKICIYSLCNILKYEVVVQTVAQTVIICLAMKWSYTLKTRFGWKN